MVVDIKDRANVFMREQAKALIRMIYPYRDDIGNLRKKITKYSAALKQESISFAIEYMDSNPDKFSFQMREEIRGLLGNTDRTEAVREDKEVYKKFADPVSHDSVALSMKAAIDSNDIEEIKRLDKMNKTSGSVIKINDVSPLEYAMDARKDELALKMMKAGFVLNHISKVDGASVDSAIKNIIERRAGRNIVQEILDGKMIGARQRSVR